MSTTAPARLICPECRRENEPERIYCHDCGTRLDRSALGPRNSARAETAEQMHKRVSSMFDGRRGHVGRLILKCMKLLLGAALAAGLVLILLPPPALPPIKKSEILPPQIGLDLEAMVQYHKPTQLRYSEEEVNAYLGYLLAKKKEKLDHLLLDFERAIVSFHPNSCNVTVSRSILGYSIYQSGSFDVRLQDGKLSAAATRGAIGRLPIPPTLMRYSSFVFGDVVSAMERERKLIERTRSVEVGEKEIIFAAP